MKERFEQGVCVESVHGQLVVYLSELEEGVDISLECHGSPELHLIDRICAFVELMESGVEWEQ